MESDPFWWNRLAARVKRWRLPGQWRALPWGVVGWCLHGLWAFLILLIWNSSGDPDVSNLSFSITLLQTFLILLAVGGFWLLRSEVRSRAAEEIESIAPKLVREELYPKILRELIDSEGLFDGMDATDEQIGELVTEMGREEHARERS
ncbi:MULTISPECIES: hypothetical protein [Afifella]|uniref:hypothetical protein n=1 Tax=Afifella TaxID=643217 RepID=UPI0013E3E116|nr:MULTISPECIES: hypothetical protein [Afifella]MCT8266783.1 hypothetical protein [Afifella sp. JA880]